MRTQDGREFVATEVLTDPQTGIAVVRIRSEKPLVAATLGDSDKVEVGDWVVQVNRKAVTTVDEFQEIVQADADGRLLLLIRTQEGTRFVVVGE